MEESMFIEEGYEDVEEIPPASREYNFKYWLESVMPTV
jgi:hypothetical protein